MQLDPDTVGRGFAGGTRVRHVRVSRLAVQTNLFTLAEWRDGVLSKVKGPAIPLPVEEYLRPHGGFAHLFR